MHPDQQADDAEVDAIVAWLTQNHDLIEASLTDARESIDRLNVARTVNSQTLHDPVTL